MCVVFADLGSVLRPDREDYPSADLQSADDDSARSGNCSYGVSGVGLLADLYVTASGILKMNRRLEAMEKIAAELKELSDKVGENIYENVMEGMEFREEKKARIEELKEKYEEMAENRTKVGERLVKAFPKMQVGQHKEIFEELRERIKRSK